MIIRVSFNDNDFQELLESQFKFGLVTPFLTIKSLYVNASDAIHLKKYKDVDDLQTKITRKIFAEKKLTKTEQQQLIDIIREAYSIKIENNYTHAKTYLMKSLTIEIISSFKDRWENGEVLYYFSTPDKYIIE